MTDSPPTLDYAGLYDDYWSGRVGDSSSGDCSRVADDLLRALGTGRVLDVGCGTGGLVHKLLSLGVDAHGVDASKLALAEAGRRAPERFHHDSALKLPFGDGEFDVVVAMDFCQHLAEHDVPAVFAELYRVSKRGVFLGIGGNQEPPAEWHRTVQTREWWENQLFAAGFRKHPRAMAIVPYAQLEQDGAVLTVIQERLPPAGLQHYSIERLLQTRDLHMDMLREFGRRSDAHVARYHLAAGFVRPNDVVLDVACGLGYGSAVIAANSDATRVIGVDLDDHAVRYATAMTSAVWPQVEFRAGDATDLAFLPDRSVDLITSFETLEHVPDPEALLVEFDRVLKPAGRVIVSVPHMWVDETGEDPNPFHLHVYDWPKLRSQLAARFVPEVVWGQTAGGGMKLTNAPRRIVRARLADPTDTPAEWWLAAAMKSPIGAKTDDYEETCYPPNAGSERPHVTAFRRDYDNPWLIKSLVARGHRAIDSEVLSQFANQTLAAQQLRDARPDAGAALCVLAYQVLGDAAADRSTIDQAIASADEYCSVFTANPNSMRWQVSLHYVVACLLQATGRREQASARFRRCADMDAGSYSPILATKTIDALLQAGLMAVADGDESAAREDWQRALEVCERLMKLDWSAFLGDRDRPLSFGMREATDVLDTTARVAQGLVDLSSQSQRPGRAWELVNFNLRAGAQSLERVFAEHRVWSDGVVQQLQAEREASADLTGQLHQQQVELQQREAQLVARGEEVEALNQRLEEQLESHREAIAACQFEIANLQRMRGVKGSLRCLVDRFKS